MKENQQDSHSESRGVGCVGWGGVGEGQFGSDTRAVSEEGVRLARKELDGGGSAGREPIRVSVLVAFENGN